MSKETTAWDSDLAWLLENYPRVNENQKEYFCERVSIAVIDGGVEESKARKSVAESKNMWLLR